MMIEIKSRWSGGILFKLETTSLKLCLEAGIKSGANLRDADLSGAKWKWTPDPELPKRVATAIINGPDGTKVDMSTWHQCETVHCIAGWAIHLSGPAGYALESLVGSEPAGCMLMPSASRMFHSSNDEAIEWAKEIVKP